MSNANLDSAVFVALVFFSSFLFFSFLSFVCLFVFRSFFLLPRVHFRWPACEGDKERAEEHTRIHTRASLRPC